MVTQLIEHERIQTTVGRAKQLRKLADRVVTFAKKVRPAAPSARPHCCADCSQQLLRYQQCRPALRCRVQSGELSRCTAAPALPAAGRRLG